MKSLTNKKPSKDKRKALLKALIYKKVLKGELPLEAAMGSSGIQAYLIILLIKFLLNNLDEEKFTLLSNELSFLYKKAFWENLDIAIFEKEKVKPYLMQNEFIPVVPKVVIKVDTEADLSRYGGVEEYVHEKTQDLLDADVEKVIWIFTKPKKVMITKKGKKWIVKDWKDDFEVIDEIKVNLNEILKNSKEV